MRRTTLKNGDDGLSDSLGIQTGADKQKHVEQIPKPHVHLVFSRQCIGVQFFSKLLFS